MSVVVLERDRVVDRSPGSGEVERVHPVDVAISRRLSPGELEELRPSDLGLRQVFGDVVAIVSTGSTRLMAIGR